MKKKILFICVVSMLLSGSLFAQTGFIEDFNDGNTSGWSNNPDYPLSNVSGSLKISANKTSTWSSFTFSFPNTDITAHPYVSMKIRSDMDFNINFFINTDKTYGNGGVPREVIRSDGFSEYIFDFSAGDAADLSAANLINIVFNPGGTITCKATVYFDDIRIGDQAIVMPSITRIPDHVFRINPGSISIPLWKVKDMVSGANPIAITAASSNTSLIPNPTVNYTSPDASGNLSFIPLTDQAGTATITVTVAGNAPVNHVMTFDVTLEPNHAPKIDPIKDVNAVYGKQKSILLSGLDDGDANANQILTVSASSSNAFLVVSPTINYTEGGFNGLLNFTPVDGQTGTTTITVTVHDDGGTIAGGDDTETTSFEVTVFSEVNNAPAMNELADVSILENSPETTVLLGGITDGDESLSQVINITAISSNTALLANPTIVYTSGNASGILKFTPVAGQTGTSTITVTVADEGGNANNNGNESQSYTFNVDVRERPISGWEDEFEDGVLGPQWPAAWGDPGENTHLCSESAGAMRIQIDKSRTNNVWAGLWFNIPTELDLSQDPYISITMRTDEAPKDMLIFLWDAYDHYNTAKTITQTVSGEFTEYYFDYSDPSFQLQGDGTKVDISRIKALLINFEPGRMYTGSFYFEDFRVGEKAHRTIPTPTVTLENIPDFAAVKDAPAQTIILNNLTDGGDGSQQVIVTATSSNTAIVGHPVVSAVVNKQATLTFTPKHGITGNTNITVTAKASGSTTVTDAFKISVAEFTVDAAEDINIDLSTMYQEIDGFGAFMGSGGDSPDTIITLAKEIGMSMARFGLIGGGFEAVNDNSDPNIINLDAYNTNAISLGNMKRLAPFVDKFILTVWSPAGWMKMNKSEDGVEYWATDNKLDPRFYEEYAEEVVAYLKIVKRETGKDIYAVGLQNEPQFNEPYPSCQVDPNEFRDIIKVVGARFEAEGMGDVKLYWAEALPQQGAIQYYIDQVKKDPIAESYADIVAIHNYDGDGIHVGGAGCEYWKDIFDWAQAGNSQYKTWMTETSGHPDSWDGAMELAGNIFNALECGNTSAWVFWSFTVTASGSEFGLVVDNRPSSRYFVSKQYYKFIRPGAVRVSASSTTIPAIAFKDESAETFSIVLLNSSPNAKAVEIKGAGLPSSWESYTTSNGRNCEKGATVGADGMILLPPSSITTLYGTSKPAPTIDPIADISLDKNATEQIVNLSGISDGEGFDENITIIATSNNPTLIPNPMVNYVNKESTGSLSFTPAVDLTGTATITVMVTDDGIPSASTFESFVVKVGPTDINSNEVEHGIVIYPNPVTEQLQVDMFGLSYGRYEVLSTQGSVIISGRIENEHFAVNTTQLAKGVYILKLIGDNQTRYKEFIK